MGKGNKRNRIGNVVAGDYVASGAQVTGGSVDGRSLPPHRVLEIRNNRIYLDGVEYDPEQDT